MGGAVVKNRQTDGGDHEDDRRPGGQPGKHVGRGAGAESGLRSLAAEGAGQVSRATLLKQDHSYQEEANEYMYGNDKIEENLHFFELLSESRPVRPVEVLVRRRGLEPLCLVGASTSSWCVCQCRHLRLR
jgi:hypothetical protein